MLSLVADDNPRLQAAQGPMELSLGICTFYYLLPSEKYIVIVDLCQITSSWIHFEQIGSQLHIVYSDIF